MQRIKYVVDITFLISPYCVKVRIVLLRKRLCLYAYKFVCTCFTVHSFVPVNVLMLNKDLLCTLCTYFFFYYCHQTCSVPRFSITH